MNSVILDKILVEDNKVTYDFSVTGNVRKYFQPAHRMFLEYNRDLTDIPLSILAIPFVANVIPLIWITDSTLLIDELDESFYHCLDPIKAAYQDMFPKVNFKGRIGVDAVVANRYTPEVKAASLFSGGLDAVTTYIRIKDQKPLLITEYGWHQQDIRYSEVWEADKANAVRFAEQRGLGNILVQSNYGNFMVSEQIDADFHRKLGTSWWQGLHHGLAIISAGIPIAYQQKVKCIYIASSLHVGHIATIASDPRVDNQIRYASGQVYHDAYDLTRQDKVKVVIDHCLQTKESFQLRVCFKNAENCCHCEKCIRTILGIVAEGGHPQDFGFDIPHNLSQHVRNFLNENVKFLPPDLILMVWNVIKRRMAANRDHVLYPELLGWFLDYDLTAEQKKSLRRYRVTKFFPILKRKINERIHSIRARNLNT